MLRLHLDSLIREFLDLERDRLDVMKIQYRHLTHSQQSVYRRLQFKRPHLLASLHATHSLLISHCTHPGYTIHLATFKFLPSCFRHRELCLLCLGPHFKLSAWATPLAPPKSLTPDQGLGWLGECVKYIYIYGPKMYMFLIIFQNIFIKQISWNMDKLLVHHIHWD